MLKKVLASVLVLGFANCSYASTTTYTTQNWNFASSSSATNVTNSGSGNSQINLSVGTVDVKVTAWSSTGDGSCGTGVECGNTAARDDDPFIERAILKQYNGSGLGAINNDEDSDSPDHALDNRNGNSNELDFDMVLFEFDTAVELTGVKSGWYSSDSDLSIVGYTGTGTLGSTPFGNGNTKWSDLLNNGWASVTDTFDQGTNNQTIAPGYESRYWLVGVYNPVFNGTSFTHHNDAVKLASITTRQGQPQTQIPEPATFALMLAGVAAIFRRKSKV